MVSAVTGFMTSDIKTYSIPSKRWSCVGVGQWWWGVLWDVQVPSINADNGAGGGVGSSL